MILSSKIISGFFALKFQATYYILIENFMFLFSNQFFMVIFLIVCMYLNHIIYRYQKSAYYKIQVHIISILL